MNDSEIRAFLTIALMAALADGAKDDRESAALKSLAGRLGEGRIDLTDVYDDVLVRKISIADAVRPLTTTEARRQAYETAVAVAAADGVHSPAEGAFLRDLAAALGLPAQEAQGYVAQADAVAASRGRRQRERCRAGPPGARARDAGCGRTGSADRECVRDQRRTGTVAGIARLDGDPAAAGAARLPDRQGLRLRTRPGTYQGIRRDAWALA